MATRQLPDAETLRKLLRYDADTGKLFWRERTPNMFSQGRHGQQANCKRWNNTFANREAFAVSKSGYCRGKIFGQEVLAHRVAWAMSYGHWPAKHLDHINRNRSDNRICNLREADYSENGCNSIKQKNNTSGYKGVFKCSLTNKWRARICKNGKSTNLGSFETPQEAHEAYKNASSKIHGDFGRST